MNWFEMNKSKSKKYFDEMKLNSNFESNCDKSYSNLKKDIFNEFFATLKELEIEEKEINSKAYDVDYIFGIKLYKILVFKYNMNENQAGNDDIWRYIQLKVCPQIIKDRYGINENRFYKEPRRMWLKVLWWYVYLAWRKDERTTREILKDNTTDTILNITDRTGTHGYRVKLFKEILYKKYLYKVKDRDQFRKIMTLNTMRIQVIDPYLVNGGIERYVDDLYKEIGVKISEYRRY